MLIYIHENQQIIWKIVIRNIAIINSKLIAPIQLNLFVNASTCNDTNVKILNAKGHYIVHSIGELKCNNRTSPNKIVSIHLNPAFRLTSNFKKREILGI